MAFAVHNQVLRAAIARTLGAEPKPGVLHLFGVRGAIPYGDGMLQLQPNVPDVANDTLGFFGAEFGMFRGSVDPGSTYTKRPTNPDGCFHLVNGIYRYTPGLHRGKPALRQAGPVRGWRDRDRDYIHDVSEKEHDPGYIGINIHAMGASLQVGPWSAGCQVILGGWSGKPWTTFRDTVYRHYQPGEIVLYHLLDAQDLLS